MHIRFEYRGIKSSEKGLRIMERQLRKEELIRLVNESKDEFIIHVEFGEEEGQDAKKE